MPWGLLVVWGRTLGCRPVYIPALRTHRQVTSHQTNHTRKACLRPCSLSPSEALIVATTMRQADSIKQLCFNVSLTGADNQVNVPVLSQHCQPNGNITRTFATSWWHCHDIGNLMAALLTHCNDFCSLVVIFPGHWQPNGNLHCSNICSPEATLPGHWQHSVNIASNFPK